MEGGKCAYCKWGKVQKLNRLNNLSSVGVGASLSILVQITLVTSLLLRYQSPFWELSVLELISRFLPVAKVEISGSFLAICFASLWPHH